jgi:uncharacterized protein affecting Mg2+/Co2+ transport
MVTQLTISIHIHSRYYSEDDQERYAFSYKNNKTEKGRIAFQRGNIMVLHWKDDKDGVNRRCQ